MLIRCPHCQVPLTRDEARGDGCPACGKSLSGVAFVEGELASVMGGQDTFRRENQAAARADDYDDRRGEWGPLNRARPYDDDYGRRSSSRVSRTDHGWRTVQSGLTTMLAGYMVILVAFVVNLMVQNSADRLDFGRANPRQIGAGLMVWALVLGVAFLGGGIVHLVGMLICLAAPHGKKWMVGCLTMIALFALIVAGATIARATIQPGGVPHFEIVVYSTAGVALISLALVGICLILFLKRLGEFFGSSVTVICCNLQLALVVLVVHARPNFPLSHQVTFGCQRRLYSFRNANPHDAVPRQRRGVALALSGDLAHRPRRDRRRVPQVIMETFDAHSLPILSGSAHAG